ncbi:MAG TPA: rod shape-determining protein RodA [Dehalococcoidia bacterium]|nr:rod shape-determining protein RodA [Dehalococcoidia bacterium]
MSKSVSSLSRPLLQFDYLLALVALCLVAYGVLMNYSASFDFLEPESGFFRSLAFRQLVYAIVGMVIFAGVIFVRHPFVRRIAPLIYIGALITLVVVHFVGTSSYGARRWIDFGFFSLQASEAAKVGTIVMLARFFADREKKIRQLRTFLLSLVIAGIPIVLVYLEPDLGSAVLIGLTWLACAAVAGVRALHLLGFFALIAAAIPVAYETVLQGYMKKRLETFLNPEAEALDAGYNILQAEISVGSGGLLGKGYLQGTQTQNHFLRVQNTDFIFSVIGEELGFLGACVLLGLFAILLLRLIRIATLTDNVFGRVVAGGTAGLLLMQVFINIGINTRLLPVTGVPLPMISFGGSSMLTTFFLLGLIESVATHREKPVNIWGMPLTQPDDEAA